MPKSWKPEWSKEPDNLLKVPAKAHYIIHHLMWKAFLNDQSMRWAFWKICNKHQKMTARVYESLKNNLNHSEETKQKIREARLGKTHSEESKQKMRGSRKTSQIPSNKRKTNVRRTKTKDKSSKERKTWSPSI